MSDGRCSQSETKCKEDAHQPGITVWKEATPASLVSITPLRKVRESVGSACSGGSWESLEGFRPQGGRPGSSPFSYALQLRTLGAYPACTVWWMASV